MIAKSFILLITAFGALLIAGCTQTIEATGKATPVASLERKISEKYVAVLKLDPGKPIAGDLSNPNAPLQSLAKQLFSYKLVFGP